MELSRRSFAKLLAAIPLFNVADVIANGAILSPATVPPVGEYAACDCGEFTHYTVTISGCGEFDVGYLVACRAFTNTGEWPVPKAELQDGFTISRT